MNPRRVLTILFAPLALLGVAHADALEDAVAAYQRADYPAIPVTFSRIRILARK